MADDNIADHTLAQLREMRAEQREFRAEMALFRTEMREAVGRLALDTDAAFDAITSATRKQAAHDRRAASIEQRLAALEQRLEMSGD